MKRACKRAERGETLVETLAAILILSVSAVLLLQLTLGSARLNRRVEQADGDFRAQLAAAEGLSEPTAGEITVQGERGSYTYAVEYYGEPEGLCTYRVPSAEGE